MCVDYRKLNSITERENFPLPNIEETLNTLAQKKIFTSLDLYSGYYQVPIEEKSRKYTAFVTTEGHYEYKRVPFGLTNSPAVFLRLMKAVFGKVEGNNLIVYMDDILIATATMDENLRVLEEALKLLREAGLTLKIEKCTFMKDHIKFLGHEVSNGCVTPGLIKTKAIDDFKRPENIKQVRKFLGLAGYFRRFIKDFANKASPLHQLLKKNANFKWTKETEKSFQDLKMALTSKPVLTLYDFKKDHELHTDASAAGIAGILLQNENGQLKPVSYYSRTTTEYESKYHSYELETLAVVESIERFRHYLLMKRFKVVTDCSALKATHEKRNLVPRIARWWLKIIEFDFSVEHKSGKRMDHVDALSRSPVEKGRETETVASKVMKITAEAEDWIATLQSQDSRLQEIISFFKGKNPDHPERDSFKGTYILRNNRLYKKTVQGERFVVPKNLKLRIIRMAHDESAHCGVMKTISNIQKYFWFPGMRKAVKKYLNSCIECLYHKRGNDEAKRILYTPTRIAVPFHTIHIDHLGPFPKSKKGNMHLIGIIDSFTKFIFLKAVRSTDTKGVLNALDEMTQFVGIPRQIITDRGSAFTSKDFSKYCEQNDIYHVLTTVHIPRGNGQIERYFRTVKTAVATLTKNEDGSDWDKNIKGIQWSLNNTTHSITRKSPHQLLFDYTPRSIMGNKLLLALQQEGEDNDEDNIPLSKLRERILRRIEEKQQQQAAKFNEGRTGPRKYEKGQLVLIKHEAPATGAPRKTQPRYKGPYQVAEVIGNDRYLIRDPETGLVSQKPYEAIHSAERMKPWLNLEDFELDTDEESDDE